jgi:hypothetical protein
MQPKRLPYKPEYWHIVGEIIKHGHFNIRHPSWNQYINISP